MKFCFVPSDSRYYMFEGQIYPFLNVHETSFWNRYLDVFDKLHLTGRLTLTHTKPDTAPLDLSQIQFHSLRNNWFLFIIDLLIVLFNLRKIQLHYCLRLPSISSSLVGIYLLIRNKSFGCEVVGDPWDSFANKGNFILRSFSLLLWLLQKILCKEAKCIAYVTKFSLQNKYPSGSNAFSTYYSSINLTNDYFNKRAIFKIDNELRLIHVGTMNSNIYKGQDFIIKVLSKLRFELNLNIRLDLIGDGPSLHYLKELSSNMNCEDIVFFHGKLDRNSLNRLYDQSHILIFPSKSEGLPKVVIEAQARGIPCVGTNVGGIPELISQDLIFEIGDIDACVDIIKRLVFDELFYEEVSTSNFKNSYEYSFDKLRNKRIEYYKYLIN